MFVGFLRIVKHRQITFPKDKTSKNKQLPLGNSGIKIKNRSAQKRAYC